VRKFLILLLIAVLGCAAWLYWAVFQPVNLGETKFVLLRPGWSVRHIAQTLQNEGIIRSAPAFLAVHYALGQGSLKAGEYKFEAPATALEVRQRLLRGDVFARTVVVPEGYNLYDIAATVEQAGLGSADDFIAIANQDVSLLHGIDPKATSLEGYLFPDTYQFTRTDTPHDIAAAMVHRFRQTAQKIGLLGRPDIHRIVTMASIVEKETGDPAERPLVASVYYNRLNRNMLLGADPTVIYAALLTGRYRGTIYQSDLQFDSPYNTYKFPGLPPGPIANPGAASLQAAMHPSESEFLYFVSDNAGHHRFSRTAVEHEKNVAAYRKAATGSH
jgi:peptidoglycan lytic transglycosylase G